MNKLIRSTIKSKRIMVAIIIIGMLINAPVLMAQDFSTYHNYDQMTKELKSLVNANKGIAKIESIGKTIEGRDIWVVTIANQKGVPTQERPGMFIGANFEGDHLIGSQISLSVINYLLKNYNADEAVKKSIDEHVFYVIPRMNPDGAEKMFASVKTGQKTNTSEYDGDNDGRLDEDGPEDLNNDGLITMMRVKDENGLYTLIKNEARLMKKADPAKGESGSYSIYWEGIDNDKDGFINEDPKGGVDINRNFMHEYPYYKEDAGWHMVSEKESIALMAWIIKHRNIAIMLNFGESDNLIVAPDAKGKLSPAKGIDMINMASESYAEAGKVGMVNTSIPDRFARFRMRNQEQSASGGRQRFVTKPETTFNLADLEYFKKANEMYGKLTGIKTQPPLRNPEGAFFQYGYFQFGVLSLSTPGWGIDATKDNSEEQKGPAANRKGGPGKYESIDQKFLSYLDENQVKGFVDWQTFNHPELGEVEIGGFAPYEVNNPPASKIVELGEAHAKFALWLSDLYAEVKIAKTEVINHGSGIFRIKAEIENAGFLPTALKHGVTSRTVNPTMVQLGIDPKAIISGNDKTNFFQSLEGSGKRQKYEWLIEGKAGDKIELKVVSQKAGTDKLSITLK